MGKADGARTWARVLSEQADVSVTVKWKRPAWRVHWQDGPNRHALSDRAAALSTYRVGAPLLAEELRFNRSNSAQAVALGWLANGGPGSPETVEAWCEDTGYPQARYDAHALAAAELLPDSALATQRTWAHCWPKRSRPSPATSPWPRPNLC